jgi:hypothetical protein
MDRLSSRIGHPGSEPAAGLDDSLTPLAKLRAALGAAHRAGGISAARRLDPFATKCQGVYRFEQPCLEFFERVF